MIISFCAKLLIGADQRSSRASSLSDIPKILLLARYQRGSQPGKLGWVALKDIG